MTKLAYCPEARCWLALPAGLSKEDITARVRKFEYRYKESYMRLLYRAGLK